MNVALRVKIKYREKDGRTSYREIKVVNASPSPTEEFFLREIADKAAEYSRQAFIEETESEILTSE